MIFEVLCKISDDLLECERMFFEKASDISMEKSEVFVIHIKQSMEDFTILLSERSSMEFIIGNSF